MGKVNIFTLLFLFMPFIINIHGPIASGKTTITVLLRKRLKNIVYINRPTLKKDLKILGKETARKISSEASYFMLGKLLKIKKNILVSEIVPSLLYLQKHCKQFSKPERYDVVIDTERMSVNEVFCLILQRIKKS